MPKRHETIVRLPLWMKWQAEASPVLIAYVRKQTQSEDWDTAREAYRALIDFDEVRDPEGIRGL